MAPSTINYPANGLKIAILTVAFIFFFFTIQLSKSVDTKHSVHNESTNLLQQRKTVLGSRPPQCENRCLNCRPCFATLVIPSHDSHYKTKVSGLTSHNDGDDRYYLLSWKCKCGQKLYQP
ncbi:EPIDERMAL PATTERNING FACTOR-like protein 8 [Argentina anserina]|uniref:EPIDERMAL PATTERNING FACTOR-like protein 8 n=1 Tax=Argentina anserina TaxID=57926 RepID=UPI0021769222|nr:EPIDERMAL PATTERNING FACTOR-like protein 8 [Potentilla anserina]